MIVLSIELDHCRKYLDGAKIDWKNAAIDLIESREGGTGWGFSAEERSDRKWVETKPMPTPSISTAAAAQSIRPWPR